jgi:anti-anti-sigma factor
VTCWDRAGRQTRTDVPAARVIGPDSPPGTGVGRPSGPHVEVVLGAEMVAARAAEIHGVVDRVLQAAPAVVRLSLQEVRRFDAAGLGLLLRVHQQARRRGVEVVCTCPPREMVAVLQRTGLDRVLTVAA